MGESSGINTLICYTGGHINTEDGQILSNVIDLIKMSKAAARGIFIGKFGSISTEFWDSY